MIPASGTSGVIYDGWEGGNVRQYYSYTTTAVQTIIFTNNWSNAADIDLLMVDNPATAFQCGFGGAGSSQPEVLGCETLPAGAYSIRVELYSGDEPGVISIDMTTQ